jgi:hypothetical protein
MIVEARKGAGDTLSINLPLAESLQFHFFAIGSHFFPHFVCQHRAKVAMGHHGNYLQIVAVRSKKKYNFTKVNSK